MAMVLPSGLPAADFAVHLLLSVILIVGVYQFYFWCQRRALRPAREFAPGPLDRLIPYRPGWVWIYSGLYYPAILYANLAMRNSRQFVYLAVSYLLLLAAQMAFFLLFPVVTPEAWRAPKGGAGWSQRFVDLVQALDSRANCFPSMHCSVAMLTALHLLPLAGPAVFLFPALIGVSCLFTKQHYFVDLAPGLLLGWGVHAASVRLLPGLAA